MQKFKLLFVAFVLTGLAASTLAWKSPAPWSASEIYKGNYADEKTGDTVTHFTYDGQPMYWWTKWWTQGDEPGTLMDSGATNPWVFMNAQDPRKPYVWKGCDDDPGSDIKVCVPTWRDGAKAAYSITHDDICAMSYENFVKPQWDFAKKYGIQTSWGVKGDECTSVDYDNMLAMLYDGTEITSHSWNHHSAAEQWEWCYHDETTGTVDQGFPEEYAEKLVDTTLAKGTITDTHLGWNAMGWWDDASHPDLGYNVKMVKILCYEAWTQADFVTNVDKAKEEIDKNIYAKFNGNMYFPKDKECEFYIYPYDAFSNETHEYLDSHGFVGARGGSKSGVPMRGDFNHPYYIDFDAYYLVDNNPDLVYPDNPHSLLSLEGLVDEVIKSNGYMIRELHAVADNADDYWGAVPKNFYEAHLKRLEELIEKNDLTVLSVSEAIKYRITANSVTGVNASADGDNEWVITVDASGCVEKYQDEICVIATLPSDADDWDELGAVYDGKAEFPRRQPRKIDTRSWSVSVNPYIGAVRIIGDTTLTDIIEMVGTKLVPQVKFISFVNGRLSIFLKKGCYKATIFNPKGQIVSMISGETRGGLIRTHMNVKGLSNGFYILNVKHSTGTLYKRIAITR